MAACTTTARGTCIAGGQFCPAAGEGVTGVDAAGRSYVCRDARHDGHPHWMRP